MMALDGEVGFFITKNNILNLHTTWGMVKVDSDVRFHTDYLRRLPLFSGFYLYGGLGMGLWYQKRPLGKHVQMSMEIPLSIRYEKDFIYLGIGVSPTIVLVGDGRFDTWGLAVRLVAGFLY